jgi:predicted metalloendopeptidase
LNKINIKIGYPDKERLFLNIKKNSWGGSYFENMKKSLLEFPKDIDKLTNQLIKQSGTCRHKQ